MKVSAGKREFHIFSLFLHDGESSVTPFEDAALREWLNKKATKLYPDYYVEFQCPDDTFASSHWYVRFALNRWVHDMKPDSFPKARVYDEREFRRSLPVELDEVLLELEGQDIVL